MLSTKITLVSLAVCPVTIWVTTDEHQLRQILLIDIKFGAGHLNFHKIFDGHNAQKPLKVEVYRVIGTKYADMLGR